MPRWREPRAPKSQGLLQTLRGVRCPAFLGIGEDRQEEVSLVIPGCVRGMHHRIGLNRTPSWEAGRQGAGACRRRLECVGDYRRTLHEFDTFGPANQRTHNGSNKRTHDATERRT